MIDQAMAVFTALAALKVKRGQYRSTAAGIEIQQPGKPVLLLTYSAALDFAHAAQEAQND
jgi:hypothetical protein